MSKVVKFGGSSLASAEQFRKVGDIVRSDAERRYVVPSAPGKRFKGDSKVTDMLYACYDLADEGRDFGRELGEIKARYQEIIEGLKLELDISQEFRIIEENFKAKAGSNYAASRGEYLNGIIMAAYLGYEFIDAAEVIFFDEEGNFDSDKTDKVLSACGMSEGCGARLLRLIARRNHKDLFQRRIRCDGIHRGQGCPGGRV